MKRVAYIDASNLKFGVEQSGWKLDYKSFRSWLRDKFQIDEAILFMGLIPEYSALYNYLQNIGYKIVFRPTLKVKDGTTKGNVDGEIILHIAEDFFGENLQEAILVSGDGDYYCVVEFLKRKKVPIKIVSPNNKYLSLLLKRTGVPIIILEEFKYKLNEKTPKDAVTS